MNLYAFVENDAELGNPAASLGYSGILSEVGFFFPPLEGKVLETCLALLHVYWHV